MSAGFAFHLVSGTSVHGTYCVPGTVLSALKMPTQFSPQSYEENSVHISVFQMGTPRHRVGISATRLGRGGVELEPRAFLPGWCSECLSTAALSVPADPGWFEMSGGRKRILLWLLSVGLTYR